MNRIEKQSHSLSCSINRVKIVKIRTSPLIHVRRSGISAPRKWNVRSSCNNLTSRNLSYKVIWTAKRLAQMVCCQMYADQQYARASLLALSIFQAPKNSAT